MPRRTSDIDIDDLERALGLSEDSSDSDRTNAIENAWNSMEQDIDNKLASMHLDDMNDPDEYSKRVAKESIKSCFRFLEYIKREIRSGSKSAMMFQSCAHLLQSISQTIEKLNGITARAEKNEIERAKIKIKVGELRVKQQNAETNRLRLKAAQNNKMGNVFNDAQILVMTHENALKEADKELKKLEETSSINVDVEDINISSGEDGDVVNE